MPIDPRHVGRKYGPFRYLASLEKIRDFALAVSEGVPGRIFWRRGGAAEAHPWSVDEAAGTASPWGSVIAPPTFCVNFAMEPFVLACSDPALGLDLVRLLHAEQEFTFHEPVRPGDELTTTGEIAEVYAKGALDFMVVRTVTRNQHGRPVVEGRWTAVVRN
jgi:acyl dehydratase